MRVDDFAQRKRFVRVGTARVAYREEGHGEPLLLVHGCPFSSFVWREVIALASPSFRCLAPDLLGLGDTETPPDADWSLRAQSATIVGFLDALGVERCHVVGHDHGGAVAQLLAAEHPERIARLVIANAEAYDNWPSREERPFVRATQVPLLGYALLWAWSWRPLFRLTMATGKAVCDRRVLTPELLDGYIRANLGDRHRRAKTRRFLAGQLDPAHNRTTLELLDGLRRFHHPTLLLWATDDPHFGPEWGKRLQGDIPGVVRLELIHGAGHLLMEERPDQVAALILEFLFEPIPPASRSPAQPSAAIAGGPGVPLDAQTHEPEGH
jgi:2-hydroxymuconate-semialdehyde hydrolase